MADSCYDTDELLNVENSLDYNAVKKQPAGSKIVCVMCGCAPASVNCHIKLLPCLHITCQDCLVQFLTDKSLPGTDADFAASIFTCPCCSYAIQLPSDGVTGLKDVSFLQTLDSDAVTSDERCLNDGEDCKQSSVSLTNHVINGAAADAHGIDTILSLGSSSQPEDCKDLMNYAVSSDVLMVDTTLLSQSLLEANHCKGDKSLLGSTRDDAGVNVEDRGACNVSNVLVADATLSFGNLSQSLLESKQCEAANSFPGSNRHDLNREDRSTSNVSDELTLLPDARSHIHHLSQDAECRQRECLHALEQIKLATCELDARKIVLRNTISKRAEYLCQLINSRRDQLFEELDRELAESSAMYCDKMADVDVYRRRLEDSCRFAGVVLTARDVSGEVETGHVMGRLNLKEHPQSSAEDVAGEVVARLEELLMCNTLGVVDMLQVTGVRLDVPQESHVERLFGSLVRGTVGSVDCLRSFHTDLQWPVGLVVTSGRGWVLVGKAGAFADRGQVMFLHDSHEGTCVQRHMLPAGHLPVDVVTVDSGGHVLMSDVSGRLTKFMSSGDVVAEWTDVFRRPGGHMAVCSCNEVLVTSECCVHRYSATDGQRLATVSLQWPTHLVPDITAITVNSHSEIIVAASNFHNPYFFTSGGQFLLHRCDHGVKVHTQNGLNALPAAMCCDPFDNVLVADFLANCIHLYSSTGSHMGRLLTKAHGIACPNLITLDQDGRLYVGQYGGDVHVFRYLSSQVKHA